MKTILHLNTYRAILFTLMLTVIAEAPARAASPAGMPEEGAPQGDSIVIKKKILKRSHRFDLYPDASNHVVFFNARGAQGTVYQLYVFNVEGDVVKQTEIRNNQTTLIKDIEKGIYLFEVFSDDDKIGNGQIAVL